MEFRVFQLAKVTPITIGKNSTYHDRSEFHLLSVMPLGYSRNCQLKNEWKKFKVGTPSIRERWTELECSPFSRVAHVSHLSSSLEIVRSGKIKSGLVFDESKLNQDRILVSWLSPNYWNDGFRYGNVRFQFEWDQIVRDKKFYWVEDMAYSTPACRILITANEHNELDEYFPMRRDGPWWYDTDNDQHYFNGKYCLEFMVESDLEIYRDVEVDFVSHHHKYCAMNRNTRRNCRELGMTDHEGAGVFVSAIVANNINIRRSMFPLENPIKKGVPNAIYKGFSIIYINLVGTSTTAYKGEIKHTDSVAATLVRAACCAYSVSKNEDIVELRSMFKNKENFGIALESVILTHFKLDKNAKLICN